RQVSLPLEIGRALQCGLRLTAWRVARRHARIGWTADGAFIDDFGSLGGTVVNGKRITRYGPLQMGDEIIIGPCLISVRQMMHPNTRSTSAVMQVGAGASAQENAPLA